MRAGLLGAQEVGFTVLSISLSLIAVFVPILLMGGILGRLFREFTITLSLAIMISFSGSLPIPRQRCRWEQSCAAPPWTSAATVVAGSGFGI